MIKNKKINEFNNKNITKFKIFNNMNKKNNMNFNNTNEFKIYNDIKNNILFHCINLFINISLFLIFN